MKKLFKALLVLIIIILVIIGGLVVYIMWLKPVHLENLEVMTLSGETLTEEKITNDKYTLLNFWATWCAPCIAEMPMLDSAYALLDTSRWQVLMLSSEPLETIMAFKDRNDFSFTFMQLKTSLSELGVTALPKTIVLDPARNVIFNKTGELQGSANDLTRTLESLLAD